VTLNPAEVPASTVTTADPEFRQDINALRAIAVAAVMLFHFRVPGFSGGFVGVDVFFAISGFLMTRIIATARDRGGFSVLRFLRARAARILPALFVLVVTVNLVSALVLPPVDLRAISRYGAFALLFWSNQILAGESGYFAPSSDENPFLHTWSLALEWQFYLLLPFALMGRGPLRRQGWLVLGFGLAGSAAFATFEHNDTIRFFTLGARAWELALGGLAYLATSKARPAGPSSRWRPYLAMAGLVQIACGIWLVDPYVPWPIPWAILPVMGTAVVIASRHQFAAYAWAPVQALGRWSYSVYLWHWPTLVALRFMHLESDVAWIAMAMTLSIVLGYLSYRWIEVPARVALRTSTGSTNARVAGAWVAAILANVLFVKIDGWPQRRPAMADSLRSLKSAEADWTFPGRCVNWKTQVDPVLCTVHPEAVGSRRWLVVGDSHAQHMWPYFEAKASGRRIDFMTAGGCPPLPGLNLKVPGYDCPRIFDRVDALVRSGLYERVIVAAWWDGYFTGDAPVCMWQDGRCGATIATTAAARASFDAVSQAWRAWHALGTQVYAFLPEPRLRVSQPRELARRRFMGIDEGPARAVSADAYFRTTGPVRAEVTRAASMAGATVIDPAAQLCDTQVCRLVDAQGEPILRDGSHFRASWVAKSMAYPDEALLARPRRPGP